MKSRIIQLAVIGAIALGLSGIASASESPRRGEKRGECANTECQGGGRTEARERQGQGHGEGQCNGQGEQLQTRRRAGKGQGQGQGQNRQGEGQGQGWHRDGTGARRGECTGKNK